MVTRKSEAGDSQASGRTPAHEAASLLFDLYSERRRSHQRPAVDRQLTIPQASLLWLVDETPKPMSALARALRCDNSNVTGLVDKLESRGLVVREPSPDDRRVKLVRLTDKGIRMRGEVRQRIQEDGLEWISTLDLADQQALVEILRRGKASMQALPDAQE